ncbi:MAG: argininosuccinate lyase [Chloroflexi bacterium]|nr:argininosuccinate lyase [Chloroflexota bacterium]
MSSTTRHPRGSSPSTACPCAPRPASRDGRARAPASGGDTTDPRSYTASIHFDRRLYRQDITGSVAHARMLARQGIISETDADAIVRGMEEVRREIEEGSFPWREELEDVHMNIERRLQEKIGAAAGRLHTGRSRNDQVATDVRLYLKEAINETLQLVRKLQRALVEMASANKGLIMPGYTHLQRGQPVLFAHHLLAYFEMLRRDAERLADCYRRTDVLPLGSGALAGSPYPLDREWVAKELGFSSISRNSMDAVSDRDFLVEFHACAALCMMHLSRMAEELVLWSSSEFGFVRLADEYTTGSSLMPQKRNPDFAELARGKTGRVYGHLMGILTVMKGLPLTYNRDLQEDKEALFDTLDTLQTTLKVFAGMVSTMQVVPERMTRAAEDSAMLATDVADYLVARGMPFREAHGVVRALASYAVERGRELRELSLEEYRRFSPLFQVDVLHLTAEASVRARDIPGGTSPRQVESALQEARRLLEETGGE